METIEKVALISQARQDDDSVDVSTKAYSSYVNSRVNDYIRTTMTNCW